MAESSKEKVAVIIGPTASGKTKLALQLAETIGGEILSADSRQIYRRLNIGTAKPTPEELKIIPHHLVDMLDPTEIYSAGDWGRDALQIIKNLFTRKIPLVIVGGSGFYIKALIDGFFNQPEIDKDELLKVREHYQKMRLSTLRLRLKSIDPASAMKIPANDRQRCIRALEIFEMTGMKLSDLQKEKANQDLPFDPIYIGIDLPREILYERINHRTEKMILAGLIEEVEYLISDGYPIDLNALQTVGYREVFPHLQGRIGLYETVLHIKQNTRRYAKRQLTWFRQMENVNWLDGLADDETQVHQCLELLK